MEADLATEEVPQQISGSLSFSGSNNERPNIYIPDNPMSGSSQFDQKRLLFQIVSSDEVHTNDCHYVTYTVVIISTPGVDAKHARVERRYSDFRALNEALRAQFPRLMQDVAFPPKKLFGNFAASTIAKRRDAFEIYFRRLDDLPEVKRSRAFVDFFTAPEQRRAYELIRLARYVEARPLLENLLNIQEKLAEDALATLAALVLCLDVLDQREEASVRVKEALQRADTSPQRATYLVPLLCKARDLSFHLGKNRHGVDEQLRLAAEGVEGAGGKPSLLEVVTKCYAS